MRKVAPKGPGRGAISLLMLFPFSGTPVPHKSCDSSSHSSGGHSQARPETSLPLVLFYSLSPASWPQGKAQSWEMHGTGKIELWISNHKSRKGRRGCAGQKALGKLQREEFLRSYASLEPQKTDLVLRVSRPFSLSGGLP